MFVKKILKTVGVLLVGCLILVSHRALAQSLSKNDNIVVPFDEGIVDYYLNNDHILVTTSLGEDRKSKTAKLICLSMDGKVIWVKTFNFAGIALLSASNTQGKIALSFFDKHILACLNGNGDLLWKIHGGWGRPVFSEDGSLVFTGSEMDAVASLITMEGKEVWRESGFTEAWEARFAKATKDVAICSGGKFRVLHYKDAETGKSEGNERIIAIPANKTVSNYEIKNDGKALVYAHYEFKGRDYFNGLKIIDIGTASTIWEKNCNRGWIIDRFDFLNNDLMILCERSDKGYVFEVLDLNEKRIIESYDIFIQNSLGINSISKYQNGSAVVLSIRTDVSKAKVIKIDRRTKLLHVVDEDIYSLQSNDKFTIGIREEGKKLVIMPHDAR